MNEQSLPDNDMIYGVFNQKFGGRIKDNRLFRELYDSHVELADGFRARFEEMENNYLEAVRDLAASATKELDLRIKAEIELARLQARFEELEVARQGYINLADLSADDVKYMQQHVEELELAVRDREFVREQYDSLAAENIKLRNELFNLRQRVEIAPATDDLLDIGRALERLRHMLLTDQPVTWDEYLAISDAYMAAIRPQRPRQMPTAKDEKAKEA